MWKRICTLSSHILFIPLRVPSEAIQLRRAFHDDPISEPVDQPEKALIGVGKFTGSDALVIKMDWGKNLEGGGVYSQAYLHLQPGGFSD